MHLFLKPIIANKKKRRERKFLVSASVEEVMAMSCKKTRNE